MVALFHVERRGYRPATRVSLSRFDVAALDAFHGRTAVAGVPRCTLGRDLTDPAVLGRHVPRLTPRSGRRPVVAEIDRITPRQETRDSRRTAPGTRHRRPPREGRRRGSSRSDRRGGPAASDAECPTTGRALAILAAGIIGSPTSPAQTRPTTDGRRSVRSTSADTFHAGPWPLRETPGSTRSSTPVEALVRGVLERGEQQRRHADPPPRRRPTRPGPRP